MAQKIITQTNMREQNLMEVFCIIRKHGEVTRRQLQELAGLSWGGVSQIVSRLLEQQYLVEEQQASVGPGRTPLVLKVNVNGHIILGIDINKSCLTAAAMNFRNEQLELLQEEAEYENKESLLNAIYGLLDKIIEKYSDKKIFAIGVSMQSKVDEVNGISLFLEGCDGWENVPIRKLLTDRYGAPVSVTHDPDCLVASNVASFGQNVMLFRMDSGIGMSVFRDGRFYKGMGLLEIGHTMVGGDEGILEDYATIPGIEKRSGLNIYEIIKDQTENVRPYFQQAAQYMATAIINTAIIFQINQILVCGKMFDIYPGYFAMLTQPVEQKSQKVHNYLLNEELYLHKYDVHKAAVGAALIALECRLQDKEKTVWVENGNKLNEGFPF